MPISRQRPPRRGLSKRLRVIRKQKRDRKRLARTILIVLCAALLTVVLSHLTLFYRLESFSQNLEAQLRYLPDESDVAIVEITDEDYQKWFQGKSPLDTFALAHLISAIAEGKPKVIGVDIDTSDQQFRSFHIAEWWPPIVWQREIRNDPNLSLPAPMDVVGGKDPKLNASSGLAVLIDTPEDNVTRAYARMIDSTEGPLPSFAWAIVKRFPTETTANLNPSAKPLEILYSDDPAGTNRFTATASRIFELYKGAGWRENSPIKDKIVVLGGSYRLQDQHNTPLGVMSGAQVMTNVVETELRGGGYRIPRPLTLVLLEFVVGLVVALTFYRFGFLKGLVFGFLIAIPLSIFCGLIAYGTAMRLYRFAPTILAVFVYQGVEELRANALKRTMKEGEAATKEKE